MSKVVIAAVAVVLSGCQEKEIAGPCRDFVVVGKWEVVCPRPEQHLELIPGQPHCTIVVCRCPRWDAGQD
jgi:hypothetical protein